MMVKRERSRAYPGVNLEKAVGDVKQIRKKLGSGKLDKDQLSIGLGYQKYNGIAGTRISAMVQFGLLEKNKEGYSLNPLSERITHPKNESEYKEAITDAFFNPDLYSELIQKYKVDGSIPEQLDNILYRDHNIISNASKDAAKYFIESASFSEIIDNQNMFITITSSIDTTGAEIEQDSTVYVVDENTFKGKTEQYLDMVPVNAASVESQTRVFSNYQEARNQTFSFALTGGQFAQLIVPTELRPKDIQIIRKQIELLELQVEEAH